MTSKYVFYDQNPLEYTGYADQRGQGNPIAECWFGRVTREWGGMVKT